MNSIQRSIFGCAVALVLVTATVAAQGAGVPGASSYAGGQDTARVMAAASSMPVSVALGAAVPQEELEPERPFRFVRPIVRIGQDYTLRAGEAVREVRTVFGDVTLAGRVEHDVFVVLGSVRVDGTAVVEGSLAVVGGNATIVDGAAIHRDLVVVGGALTAPPDFSPGGDHVVIGTAGLGDALEAMVPWLTRGLLWGRLIVPDLHWVWIVAGIVFLVTLLVNALFHRPVGAAADAVVAKPVTVFLVGLLVIVLTVPVIAILAATIVGLAVVPFVLCGMVVALLIGKAAVARALGRSLVRQSEPDSKAQSLRSFVIGSIVIVLAYMVPVLGLATWALTTVIAIGAVSVMLRARLRREHPKERAAAVVPAPPTPPPPVAAPPSPIGAQASAVPDVAASAADDGVAEQSPPAPALVAPGGLTFPRATFLDRVVAFAVDCLLVAIAVRLLDLDRHDGWFPLLLLAYHIAFWAWRGTTLGGIVVGLRVVRMDGTDLRPVDAVVRGLSSVFSLAALGIGCFWMIYDPERQMWHDKIARTIVAKVPREVVLADPGSARRA